MDVAFWDHAELRTALANRHFGRVLRAYRCHPAHGVRPLAQEVVARWFGVTQPQLSRIENGPPLRDLDRLVAWARLLDIPEHLLWFRLPRKATPPVRRARTEHGVAPLVLAGAPILNPPPQQVAARTDDLAAVQSLRMADRQMGGGYLYATVATYLQHNLAPRLFGGSADADARSVFAAAAGLTEMAGWMAHDAGRDALAEQHMQRALGLAQVSEDRQLGAHIYGSLSHLAHRSGEPERAISLAKSGHERLGGGPTYPAIEGRLFAMEARGYAALGDGDLCATALRAAEEVLARPDEQTPSPWVSNFDEASLATEAARSFRRLGQLDAARRQAERVVESRPRERARSRAFAQLILISVLAAQGRPDEACTAAHDVLDSTRTLGSYLVVQQLEQVDRVLAPYGGNHGVAELLERLRDELRERRWLAQWLPTNDTGATG